MLYVKILLSLHRNKKGHEMMENKAWKSVLPLVVIILLGLITVYAHKKTQEEICDKVEICLQECIVSDYYYRASGLALIS